ncbi:hypothetical protein GQ457_07G001280 [Hibiscus cannabinus]
MMRYEGCGENGNRTVTLFMVNLSPMMHWSGLRQAFDFYGDVVESFEAKKHDRNGRRFGFVRFSDIWDATRAIERLNGFNLCGSRISVLFAKYESRSSYWRKFCPSVYRNQGYNYEQGERSGNKGGEISNKQVERNNPENAEQRRENASTELKSQNNDLDMSSMLNEGKRKKITGHVENEDLWKYRRCLVGKMGAKVLPWSERTVIEEKECAADLVEKEERWVVVAKERLNDEDNDVDRGVEIELCENIGPVSGIQDNVSDHTLDDLGCMGFQLRESNSEYIEPSNINALERNKKERAIRRERKKTKSQEVSELSGRSLSDSDLMAR